MLTDGRTKHVCWLSVCVFMSISTNLSWTRQRSFRNSWTSTAFSRSPRPTPVQDEVSQPQVTQPNISANATRPQLSFWMGPEFHIIRKLYQHCQSKNDFVDCVKRKALRGLNRAIKQHSIKIFDGVVLEKQNHTEPASIIGAWTDQRSFSSMTPVDQALLSQIDRLVRTHTLKVDMSEGRGEDDGHDSGHDSGQQLTIVAGGNKKGKKKNKKGGGGGVEVHTHEGEGEKGGRRKTKGGGGHGGGGGGEELKFGGTMKYLVIALVAAMGIAGPIGLKALAAVATKALVISKVALTIAGIIALKKLFSHDHHEESVQVHATDHNR